LSKRGFVSVKILRSLRLIAPLAIAGGLAAAINLSTALPASAGEVMSISAISQGDPAWAGTPLGTSPTDTIASMGCAVTSVAMLLQYYGVDTDPGALNAWLTANGGYAFDDQLVWSAITSYTGGRVAFNAWTGPDLGLIQSELNAGRPVVAEVSLYGNQHFVLIVGSNPGGFQINDPWFGDSVNFSDRYGDPATGILSIRTFIPAGGGEGPQPAWLAIRLSHLYLGR
jgi:hypothetical protein